MPQGPPFNPPGPPPFLHAPASLLSQTTPDDVSAGTIYSATQQTEITSIVIANHTVTATQYTVYHDDAGDVSGTAIYSSTTALFPGILLPGNSSDLYEADYPGNGIAVAKGGRIGFRAEQTGNFTVSLYGVLEQAR